MNVLFLCTGNYYRSRFAEEYFNARTEAAGLPHRAASRGLAGQFDPIGNPGPISAAALAELKKSGIEVVSPIRFPQKLLRGESRGFDLVVCLDEEEHRPLVGGRGDLNHHRIIFWDIKDLGCEPSETAMARCRKNIEELMAGLMAGGSPPCH